MIADRSTDRKYLSDGGTSEGSDQRTNQNPLEQNTSDGGGVAILTREQNPDANPLTNLLNAARDGSGVADLSEEDVLTAVQALTERYSSKFPVSTPPHSTEEQNVPLPVNPPSEAKDATLQEVGRKKKRPKRIQISPNYPSCVDHPGIRAGSISVTDQIGVNQLGIPCSGTSHRTVSSCKTPKSDDATTAREHRLVHSTKSQVDVTTRDSKEAPQKVQEMETAVPLETETRKKVEAVDATIKTARETETRTDISTVSSVTVKTKTTRRTVRTPRSTDRSSYAGERTSTRARCSQSGKRVIRTPKKGRATNRGLVDIDKVRRKGPKDLTKKQMIITKNELDASTARERKLEVQPGQDNVKTAKESEVLSKEKGKEGIDEVSTTRHELPALAAHVESDNLGTAKDSKDTTELAEGVQSKKEKANEDLDVSTAQRELPTLAAEPENLGTARDSKVSEVVEGAPSEKEKGKEELDVSTARQEQSTLAAPVERDHLSTARDYKEAVVVDERRPFEEVGHKEPEVSTAQQELPPLPAQMEPGNLFTARDSKDGGMDKEGPDVSTARTELPTIPADVEKASLSTAKDVKESETVDGGRPLTEEGVVYTAIEQKYEQQPLLETLDAMQAPISYLQTSEPVSDLDTAKDSKESETLGDVHPKQEKGREELDASTARLEMPTLQAHEEQDGLGTATEKGKEELDVPTARQEQPTQVAPVEQDNLGTARDSKEIEAIYGGCPFKEVEHKELDDTTNRQEQSTQVAPVEQDNLGTARDSKETEAEGSRPLAHQGHKEVDDSTALHELPTLPAHAESANLGTARVSIDDGHPTQEKGKEEPNVPTAQLELSTLRTPVEHDSVRTSRASKDHATVEGVQSRKEKAKEELDAPTARLELSTLRTPVEHDSVRTSRASKDHETVEGVQSREEKAKEELDAPTARLEQPMEEAHVEQTKLDTARHPKDSELVKGGQLEKIEVKEDLEKLSTARHELHTLPAHMAQDNLGTARESIDDVHPTQEKDKKNKEESDASTARLELSTLRTPKEPDSLCTANASKNHKAVEGVQSRKEKAEEVLDVSTARLEQPMKAAHVEQTGLDTARHSNDSELVEGGQLEKNEVKEGLDKLSTARHELPTLPAHMVPDNLGTARDSKETEQAKDGQLEKNEVKADLDKLSTARHELAMLPAHMAQDNLGTARDSIDDGHPTQEKDKEEPDASTARHELPTLRTPKEPDSLSTSGASKDNEKVEGAQSMKERAKEEFHVSTARLEQPMDTVHAEQIRLDTARHSKESEMVEGGQLEKNDVKEDHDNLSTARHELPTLAAHMEPDNLGTRDSKETEQTKDGQLEKNEVKEDLDKLSTARHELPTLPAHMEQDNLGTARDSKETEVVEGVQSIEERAKEELVVSTAQYQQTPLPAHVESDKLVTARDSNEAGKVERRRRRPFREVGPREPVTTAVEQKYEPQPVFESFEAVPAPLTYLYTSEPVSDLDTVPSHGQHDSVSTAKGIGEPILSARAPTSPLLTAVPASEESTAVGTNMDAIVQGIATALANASERRPSDFSFSRMFPALFGQSAPQAGSSASDSSVATGAARNALLPPAYRVPSPPRRPSDPKRDVVLFLSIYANKHAIASKRTVEFFIGSYEAAQREARNDVRLIIVFIHDPNLEESSRFIDHAINSIEFSDLVDRHRILLWGIGNDSEEGKFVAYNLHVNKYPFLALMCPRADGRFFSARRITGFTTATDLVSRLERSIEIVRVDLKDLREQRDKVLEDRRLMQEQERAYKESAERDKQRILAARKAKLEKLEADERERKKKKEYEERRKELVNIQVRFPCGKKFAKKFDIDDSMEKLFTAILRHDNCPDFFTVASGFPRRQLHCAPEWYHNLLSEQLEADGIQPIAYKTPSSFRAAGFNSKAVGVFVNSHSH
ncbi:unnamed protein product [Nippostrongylus brasiliensis]|uniref:UBX domain-containing protein n=1 Tax=Nippostrongylus brasiliensis TaxID=27835 RepID=A0A0N4Y1P6_NIPBR|nr:unnamed protein product [Nippostrongylus brasiliensis]